MSRRGVTIAGVVLGAAALLWLTNRPPTPEQVTAQKQRAAESLAKGRELLDQR